MADDAGGPFQEIDSFDITIPFPSGNQEEIFTGNEGIASIIMSYDIICTEPDSCTKNIPSLKLIGTSIANVINLKVYYNYNKG